MSLTESDAKPGLTDFLTMANQCCEYYTCILQHYEKPRDGPYWHEMQKVAELWRSLLMMKELDETEIARLESLVRAKWGQGHCGMTWIAMATCIDAWFKWSGRTGIGDNPWGGGKRVFFRLW